MARGDRISTIRGSPCVTASRNDRLPSIATRARHRRHDAARATSESLVTARQRPTSSAETRADHPERRVVRVALLARDVRDRHHQGHEGHGGRFP
jgi:hypothetical protein